MSSKNIGQVEDEYNQQLLKAQKETQCEEGKAAALGALECGGKEVGAINVVNIIKQYFSVSLGFINFTYCLNSEELSMATSRRMRMSEKIYKHEMLTF